MYFGGRKASFATLASRQHIAVAWVEAVELEGEGR